MNHKNLIFLYGPPFSGKSTLGKAFAGSVNLPFWDVDALIEEQSGVSIQQIFENQGEERFRKWEKQVISRICDQQEGVVALGGGALLDAQTRSAVETQGQVLFLDAQAEDLMARMESGHMQRPLLGNSPQKMIHQLLSARKDHYQSFSNRVPTQGKEIKELVNELETRLGIFFLPGMGKGSMVRVLPGGLDEVGKLVRRMDLSGSMLVVSDENVSGYYAQRVISALQTAGYETGLAVIPPGERSKSLSTLQKVWEQFVKLGLDRDSTVIGLGGGVVGDLTGFAAATYYRGISWVNIPTSLLAMVDAGIGGKTGIDLEAGKNLVGAFHAPGLVLVDPAVLDTLPEKELVNGMAEVIKHGLIADPGLFSLAATGIDSVQAHRDEIIRRGMAVKIQLVRQDPFDQNARQALNLGHTIGHGVELASGFQISHGEAVAIGMVVESQIAEEIGLAGPEIRESLTAVLETWSLPTSIPAGIDVKRITEAVKLDKKRRAGKMIFSLPVGVGKVLLAVEVEDPVWKSVLKK